MKHIEPLLVKSITVGDNGQVFLRGDEKYTRFKNMSRQWTFHGSLQDLYKSITNKELLVQPSANGYKWHYLLKETLKACPLGSLEEKAKQFETLALSTVNTKCQVKLLNGYVSNIHRLKRPRLDSNPDNALLLPLYKASFICDQFWLDEPILISIP